MRKKSIDLSLVLACYNEALLFTASVAAIVRILKNSRWSFELIFVDDGSTDRTSDLIKKYCQNHAFAHALFHKHAMGRGKSVSDGIKQARGTVVGYIDIDCEVSPVYMSEIVAMIKTKKADVVLGRRIYRTSLTSIIREVFSIGYRELANMLLHTDKLDTESGYKFFDRRKILPILAKTHHPHWFWDTEIIVWAKKAQLTIVELPVLFLRRTDKQSSVRIFPDTIDYLVNLWALHKKLYDRN